jgi:hypothetical protein
MKKLLVLSLAAVMVLAFTLPASALENVFGGYWRTRAFSEQNFSGTDNGTHSDVSRVDTRTRLYYTAILNDNLKFINQFETNVDWGDNVGGDAGADGTGIWRIRASYIDANIGAVRMTIGIQPWEQARGFIFSDQVSGVVLSTKFGDALIPFSWTKQSENDFGGVTDQNSWDIDVFSLYPVFNFGESFSLNPFVIYAYSKNGQDLSTNPLSTYGANAAFPGAFVNDDGLSVYWLGANADATLGSFNLWATAIYEGGELKTDVNGEKNIDVKAYLAAIGGNVPLGPASLHGQFFYASGDNKENDSDFKAFFGIDGRARGWSYYWAEIMGNGIFDAQLSAGSTANPSNLWAANLGAVIKPMEKLSLRGELWYAAHPEDDFTTDEKKLGTEVDLVATYQLVEGLSMDLVGAYLFADDATAVNDNGNDDDPWEVGTRLQISF